VSSYVKRPSTAFASSWSTRDAGVQVYVPYPDEWSNAISARYQ
jgi:hypothetical protein